MSARSPLSHLSCTLRVAERMDPHWAHWFDGFTLTTEPDGTTTIAGEVTDQAQLHGLLAKIRDLGVPLVSVETRHSSDPSPAD